MPPALPPIHHRRIQIAPPPAAGSTTGLRTLAVICACVFILWVAREVCIPLVLAILLAFVLSPVITLLRHWRLPRGASILATVVLAIGIILATAGAVGYQVAALVRQLPQLESSMTLKLAELQNGPVGTVLSVVKDAQSALRNMTSGGSDSAKAPKSGATRGTAGSQPAQPAATAPASPMLVRLAESETSSLAAAAAILAQAEPTISTTFIVLLVVIFLLFQREDLRDRMIRLFGSRDLNKTTHAMNEAAHRLSLYFLAQVGVNTCFGTVIGIGLAVLGVPSPMLWGFIGMLLRFVPYIGIALSASLPILLAAAVSHGWTLALETAGLFAVVEGLTGQVVEPLLYGRSTGLSPFAVIASALFWAWLWGPVGLILSTPFTVILVVLGHHVSQLQFLEILLGDEPALTPTQTFYQRILAGDVDEARDHAEEFIGNRSLCDYYDDVAMKVLRIAASDHARGALTDESLATMKRCLREFVADLGLVAHPTLARLEPTGGPILASPKSGASTTSPPVDPAALAPGWGSPNAILCVAGRGPLDEEAAAMLAQLIGQHKLGARLVPHAAASRQSIGELESEGTQMVCLVHVELTGETPYLRYLVERVRGRLPGRYIALGTWPPEAPAAPSEGRLGVDRLAGSLREMLEACVQAAEADASKTAAA